MILIFVNSHNNNNNNYKTLNRDYKHDTNINNNNLLQYNINI